MARYLLTGLLLAMLMAAACGESGQEEPPSDGSHEASAGDDSEASPGNFDLVFARAEPASGPGSPLHSVIYMTTIDGRDAQPLAASVANRDAVDEQPVYSPDGERVAFVRSENRGKANEDIYVTDGNGSEAVNLTDSPGSVDTSPAFSPDGHRIAFVSDRDGGGIYTMDADGGNVSRVIGSDSPATYAPDGEQLLFADTADGNDEGLDIFRIRTDGSDKESLLHDPSIWAEWPQFSPDGKHVTFLRAKPRGLLRDVWVMKADGSKPQGIIKGALSSSVSFSPTSERIAFASGGNRPGISVGQLNGGDVVHVHGTGLGDSSPSWSPSAPNG